MSITPEPTCTAATTGRRRSWQAGPSSTRTWSISPTGSFSKLRIEDDEPISLDNVELLSYRHTYDIRHAVVMRTLTFRDRANRETTLTSRRFVSMANMHKGALEWVITPENWSGRIEVFSALEGRVFNWGVPRYRDLESRHLNAVRTRTVGPDAISLLVQTRQSRIFIAAAARTRVYGENEVIQAERRVHELDGYIHQTLRFPCRKSSPFASRRCVRSTRPAITPSASR
jgi:trehalose/maltose hydrolase-like predicted phosphorylase